MPEADSRDAYQRALDKLDRQVAVKLVQARGDTVDAILDALEALNERVTQLEERGCP